MGMLDGTGSPLIHVGVELQGGATMDFEIDEPTFQCLERLMQQGLAGRELCDTWFGSALPLDRPTAVHIVGRRSDGSAIDVFIRCNDGLGLHPSRDRGTTGS